MPKSSAIQPNPLHPNHPDAITTRDLVPPAIIRRHFGGGRHEDYEVVGLPEQIRPGVYQVALRQIIYREEPARDMYLTDLGILPYGSGTQTQWYPDLYTTMLKRP